MAEIQGGALCPGGVVIPSWGPADPKTLRPTVMSPGRTIAAAQMRADGDSLARIARVLGVGKFSVARAPEKADDDANTAVADEP